MEYLMGYDRSYERWVLRLRLIGVPGSNARIKRFNRYTVTTLHTLILFIIGAACCNSHQFCPFVSLTALNHQPIHPAWVEEGKRISPTKDRVLLNYLQDVPQIFWTKGSGRRGVVWIHRGGCVLHEFFFLRQVSMFKFHIWREGVSIADAPSLQIWNLDIENWGSSGRRGVVWIHRGGCVLIEYLFLRQFSIPKFHIWRVGVSIADAPSLQIWNWDIENWRSSGRQRPVRHNNNKYFMSFIPLT